jgi:uncharacterized protein YeeX (DUF496 family)
MAPQIKPLFDSEQDSRSREQREFDEMTANKTAEMARNWINNMKADAEGRIREYLIRMGWTPPEAEREEKGDD